MHTSDPEEQKELLTKNHDKLISRTVTVDDIFASVNYLLGLDHGIGVTDEIDHLGNRRVRSVGRIAAEPVPHRLCPYGARCARAHDPAEPGIRTRSPRRALVNIRPVVACHP